MIVKLFRSRYFGQYIALLIFIVLLRIDAILYPGLFADNRSGFLLEPLTGLMNNFSMITAIVFTILLLIQAYFLNQILENNRLIPLNQLLPATLYILMMSSGVVLLLPNSMVIVNLIMILLLNTIFNMYGDQSPKSKAFDAGLMVGFVSLIYFPAIWFLIFIWICLVIFQNFSLRNFVITIIGVTIPIIFAGFYFFWTDQFSPKFDFYLNGFIAIKPADFEMDIYVWVIWSLFVLLFIAGFSEVSRRVMANAIEIRRKFRVLVFFFLTAMLTSFFAGADLKFHLTLALIPLAALLSAYLSQTKKLLVPEIIIALILIAIFTGKFINLM